MKKFIQFVIALSALPIVTSIWVFSEPLAIILFSVITAGAYGLQKMNKEYEGTCGATTVAAFGGILIGIIIKVPVRMLLSNYI